MILNQSNLSAVTSYTPDSVKEYFDVSVYRNVLDMLNTFEVYLDQWGIELYNNAMQGLIIATGRYGFAYPNFGGAITGYAMTALGKRGVKIRGGKSGLPTFMPTQLLFESLDNNAINFSYIKNAGKIKPKGIMWRFGKNGLPKKRALKNPNPVRDLLLLSRNINWELNRIRLPTPNNFRQITAKIQNESTRFAPASFSYDEDSSDSQRVTYSASAYIRLIESINVYGKLKLTIKTLRDSIRKEIDAAGLAKKVQEETLRLETAALIARREAEALAEARRIEILAEKKAVYEKELLDAQALKDELAQTRADLLAELKNVRDLQTVATPVESISLQEKEVEIVNTVDKISVVEVETESRTETAMEAATVLNEEIIEIAKTPYSTPAPIPNIIQPDIINLTPTANNSPVEKKKSNAPILAILTIAAGVLLS